MHVFHEVLNNLVSYFILADMASLKQFGQAHSLSDDLANAFTTTDMGEHSMQSGAMIAIADVENYPYTIVFNTDNHPPQLLQKDSQLQLRQDGYMLYAQSGQVVLLDWHILTHYTDDAIGQTFQHQHRPIISLDNGWHQVSILGGLTIQIIDGIKTPDEPTFEFIFKKSDDKPTFSANTFSTYQLRI